MSRVRVDPASTAYERGRNSGPDRRELSPNRLRVVESRPRTHHSSLERLWNLGPHDPVRVEQYDALLATVAVGEPRLGRGDDLRCVHLRISMRSAVRVVLAGLFCLAVAAAAVFRLAGPNFAGHRPSDARRRGATTRVTKPAAAPTGDIVYDLNRDRFKNGGYQTAMAFDESATPVPSSNSGNRSGAEGVGGSPNSEDCTTDSAPPHPDEATKYRKSIT